MKDPAALCLDRARARPAKHIPPRLPLGARAPRSLGQLGRDTGGAILLLGLGLGVLVTTALWFLLQLGGSIQLREAAQAAADAAALENAIWHARGMNMVAALNICLAVVVGVLVLWRLALAATTLGALLAIVASLLSPNAAGGARAALAASTRSLNADRLVADRVLSILVDLGAAQTAVAAYTPILAARAVTPQRIGGDGRVIATTFSASAWRIDGGEAPRLGGRVSLPVEAGRYSLLCEQRGGARPTDEAALRLLARASDGQLGARAAPEPAFGVLGLTPEADLVELVSRLSGLRRGIAPAVFCMPADPAADALASVARALPGITTLEAARAAGQRLERAFDQAREARDPARPVQVWTRARNGSAFLRSAALLPDHRGQVAHAEMYFDCAERWDVCALDAPWQLRWTARLRRVRPLSVLLGVENGAARQRAAEREHSVPRDPVDAVFAPLASQPIGRSRAFEMATGRRGPRELDPSEALARFLIAGADHDAIIH